MVKPIYLYGSEVLRRKAEEADLSKTEELKALITDLKETLVVADGCGLAAPQIGVSLRVVWVDGNVLADTYPYLAGFGRIMINPVITESSKEKSTYSEGCLSLPGIYADVERAKKITVEYYDENFEKKVEEFDNFAARIVLHELSHLDGELFSDCVAPIRKKILSKKLNSIASGRVHPHYNTKLVK